MSKCKKYARRSLAVVLSVLMIVSSLVCAYAEAPTIVVTGSAGANTTWTLYSDGVLDFEGTGDVAVYDQALSSRMDTVTSVHFGDSITGIDLTRFFMNFAPAAANYNITEITVDANNNTFASVDGVLFTKDLTKLVWFPGAKDTVETYRIPDGTVTIGENAFRRNKKLIDVIMPQSLLYIESYAFYYSEKILELQIPENVYSIGPWACHMYANRIYVHNPDLVFTDPDERTLSPIYDDMDQIDIRYFHYGTIYAANESTAQRHAEVFRIYFEEIPIPADNKIPASIEIFNPTTKLVFAQLEEFSAPGLAIKIHYTDGTEIVRRRGFVFEGFNNTVSGIQTISVMYRGGGDDYVTTTYDVEVVAMDEIDVTNGTTTVTLPRNSSGWFKIIPPRTARYTFIMDSPLSSVEINDELYNEYDPYYGLTGGTEYRVHYNLVEGDTITITHCTSFTKVDETDSTCSVPGYISYQCNDADCDFSYEDLKQLPDHTPTILPGKPSTCRKEGLSDGEVCAVCGELILEQVRLPKADHVDANNDKWCDVCMMSLSTYCGCMCHLVHDDSQFVRAFAKFFYPIVLFFWRIFGKEQYCDCGEKHW